MIDATQTTVRELHPSRMSLSDMAETYNRPLPRVAGRPFVRLNMVTSADGAATHHGKVGLLTSPADQYLFDELRAIADIVLVGATTVRRERYGPTIATQLLNDGLVDELCLTVAPHIIGGDETRILHRLDLSHHCLTLHSLFETADCVFMRYDIAPDYRGGAPS